MFNVIQLLIDGEFESARLHIEGQRLESLFAEICCKCSVSVVRWFLYNYSTLINIHSNNDEFFRNACLANNLELVKYLAQLFPININKSRAFILSCYKGHETIIKWLYDMGADPHIDDESAFQWLCVNGFYNLAEWLVKKAKADKSPINIRIKNDLIFTLTCQNNQYEIARLLLRLEPDIYISHSVFTSVCNTDNVDFVNWILSMKPCIRLEDFDDSIFKSVCFSNCLKMADWLVQKKINYCYSADEFNLTPIILVIDWFIIADS